MTSSKDAKDSDLKNVTKHDQIKEPLENSS